ncbi:beta-N-acetylhexosaminidase [Bartonella sp. DGB2]|uniref:beta-N-acetylhexosaminidase n=1 Tax=Bartonella sp. DGB2 TaxID=3388426 RepID=UPI0039901518
MKAMIVGLSGFTLTPQERAFILMHKPWGFILFARNIKNATQVKALTRDLAAISGRSIVPIFLDQEGGKVQHLRPPLAPDYPTAAHLGLIYGADHIKGQKAAWLMSRLHAFDLQRLGINANCLPLVDVPVAGADEIIGSRAYSDDPMVVTSMGRAAAEGLMAGGILPVMKHIPGHGRALCDTHFALARVEASLAELSKTDFVPFKALSHLPVAMTAHIVYEAIDKTWPATLSPKVVNDIIRGALGFDGLLICDDLSMKALSGALADLANGALDAGCDVVLHCNGCLDEMVQIAAVVPFLKGKALQRAYNAEGFIRTELGDQSDEAALRATFWQLME